MAPMYYRGAHAAILVYDVTDRSTFEKVRGWVDGTAHVFRNDLRSTNLCCRVAELQANATPDIVMVLAANKCDLRGRRCVYSESLC